MFEYIYLYLCLYMPVFVPTCMHVSVVYVWHVWRVCVSICACVSAYVCLCLYISVSLKMDLRDLTYSRYGFYH